ncbi:MAG: acyltransferase [Nocardiopsaceae bacterium]|nr:acyltransferase [Nocardiopsaceae bacterium]
MSELAAPPRTIRENAGSGGRPPSGFRPDIQGLRAIAVAMVVIYHLWPSLLPGGFVGVDVFFVISGYLITGHLWRGFSATGKLSLVDFWGRRARRLVPAAAIVLAVTWIVSRLVLPVTRLADTAQQILASALYFQNWQLAHDAVDYLKSSQTATPVQHFWSLSVEEQFYLVWPLLFLISAVIAAAVARGRHSRRERARGTAVRVLTTVLVAGSLAYSVWDTDHDPSSAYFVTTTRMWELGIGGLIALAPARPGRLLGRRAGLGRPRPGRRAGLGWKAGLGWLGLAAVVASAFVLTGNMPFPGDLALLPVLGSAALIAAGPRPGTPETRQASPRERQETPRNGRVWLRPARLLSARPMVFLGGISYSLYLWHFPVINLFIQWHGKDPGVMTGPALAAASVLLAWLTKSLVEDPVRLARMLKGHGWRSVSTALAAVVPVTMVAVFIVGEPPPWNGRLGPGYPGAAVLAAKVSGKKMKVPSEPVLPPPAQVSQPSYWLNGCLDGEFVAAPKTCVFGDTKDPKMTVALVGDSVAGNWWGAMSAIAAKEHWKLVTYLHATCAWSAAPATPPQKKPGPYTACTSWGQSVTNDLLKTKPQLVVASSIATETADGYASDESKGRAVLGAGEAQYWNRLKSRGIQVAAIRETPTIGVIAPTCVATYGSSSSQCATSKSKSIIADPPSATAAKDSHVPVINMNDLICGSKCRSTVGNVLVYFDDHHMTQAYSQTLAPYLLRRLDSAGVVPRT